jgi:1,4-alpha-glucan branching enzyme
MILQLPLANQQVAVLFRLSARVWAERINLVGDFNGWSTSANPMRRGERHWEARLVLPAGERYFYAYLVDGYEWFTDVEITPLGAHEAQRPVTILPVAIPQMRRSAATGR